jgi:hypothetical protein
MTPSAPSAGVETKVAAGSAVTIIAGYIAWALVTYVPGLKNTFPLDLQGQLPVIVAFALSSVAAYLAPHTPRPDLTGLVPAVSVPPAPIPAPAPPPAGSGQPPGQ